MLAHHHRQTPYHTNRHQNTFHTMNYQQYSRSGYGTLCDVRPSHTGSTETYGPPPSATSFNSRIRLVPDEREAFAVIHSMENEDLDSLLKDSAKVDEFIESLSQVKNIQQERDVMLASNKSLAEYNLGIRPKFEDLKQQIAAKYAKISELKTTLAEEIGSLDVVANKQSLETILALLQADAATSDESSEKLAQDFLEKKVETETFVEDYIPQRKEAHLKKVKVEKMTDLLQSQTLSRRAPQAAHHASTPSLYNSYYDRGEAVAAMPSISASQTPYNVGSSPSRPFMKMPDPTNYY
ncbi:vacuolar protein sorting-associated protein 37B-like [Argonauta hians]